MSITPVGDPVFRTPLGHSFARAFKPLPPEPIWQWAESWVWIKNETSSKPGPYSSDQTPWTRRLQDLLRDPWMPVWSEVSQSWYWIPVRRLWIKKCSQSGFTEGCLNGIRWSAKYRPRSCIYAIDSREEAKNISERIKPTLEKLGEDIFTGDDDDLGTYLMRLRSMRIYFMGSFSSGKFANKFASMCFADEVEEHGKAAGDTDTLSNLQSRAKTDDNGFIVGLSKPKKSSGPIAKAHATGNCEEYFVKCPHCGERQVVTFFEDQEQYPEIRREIPYSDEIIEVVDDRTGRSCFTWKPLPAGKTRILKHGHIVFSHCKDLTGAWDKARILTEAFYKCGYCAGEVADTRNNKVLLNASALWLPTAIGTPGVVSQRQSDLLSMDSASSWGEIILHFLDSKNDRTKLQGWFNHRLGLDFKEETSEMGENDVRKNMGAYKRGTIPFAPAALLIGSDVGMSYARWIVCAVRIDGMLAVIDWGNEDSPGGVAELVRDESWPEAEFPDRRHKIKFGFMDAKYRKKACENACLATNCRMFPAMGGGSNTQRRAWTWNKYEKGMPKWFGYLTFHDHDAKSSLYIDRYKKHEPGIMFPGDVFAREREEKFVEEITKESLITDEDGESEWDNKHPNHFGDALKVIDLAYDYITRPRKPSQAAKQLTPATQQQGGEAVISPGP